MDLSKQIEHFVSALNYDDLPEKVRETAILCVYNYIGCAYGGNQENVSCVTRSIIPEFFSEGKCHVFGTTLMTDPVTAAMVNGTTASSISFDDIFKAGTFHPGISAITAALTVADLVKPTGKQLIAAIVAAYEVANRISLCCGKAHYKYWHTAATVGSFCAAVAAAKLLKLEGEAFISALGTAGTQTAGLQECAGNMAQRLHLGLACRNGVLAALLAKQGFYGPQHILDGDKGFLAAMTDCSADTENIFGDLGSRYTILDTTFKLYPCCGFINACVDAAIQVSRRNNLSWKNIEKVRVGTYQIAIDHSGNPNPQNCEEAKFSIAYCVSTGFIRDGLALSDFQEWPPHEDILDLMKKVEVYKDDICESNYPLGKRGSVISVTMDDGATYDLACYDRKGDPEYPPTMEELETKFTNLVGMVLSEEDTKHLADLIKQLPELEDASLLNDAHK